MQNSNRNSYFKNIINSLESLIKYFIPLIQITSPHAFFIQGIQNLQKFKKLIQDIETIFNITDQAQKIRIIESKKFDPLHQLELKINPINPKKLQLILKQLTIFFTNMRKIQLSDSTQLHIYFQNLKSYSRLFIYIVTFPQIDLFNHDQTHQSWDQIKEFTTYKELISSEQLQDQLYTLRKILKTIEAFHQQLSENQNKSFVKRIFNYAFGVVKYFLSAQHRNRKSMEYRITMNPNKVKMALNNIEVGITGKIIDLFIFQRISYVKIIYLPYRYNQITDTVIVNWLNKQNQNQINLDLPQSLNQEYMSDIYNFCDKKIPVRVLSSQKFQRTNPEIYIQDQNDSQFVLLHIHGGGFIALTSKSHQTYTRKWANICDIPIFSIDYRKAPQFPFPYPVNDVWQAYNWILNESHKYFKIKKNKKIIVAGDSAGGNLTICLTNLCILTKIQIPHSIMPFYPALNIGNKMFTPSHLHCFNDPVICFEFLQLVQDAYIQNQKFKDNKKNYLLSPLFTPNEILQKYPPTYIYVGDKDVLHDDCIRFGLRLWNNKVKVQTIIYKNMIHGYLTMDFPGGLKSARVCIQDSIDKINQIMQN